jgi:transposase-like protein
MSQQSISQTRANGTVASRPGNGEVVVGGQRRRFSAAYKLRIVEEADECQEAGGIGALLRREGLYSSHLTDWRRERASGQLTKAEAKKAQGGRREEAAELCALRQENERLKAQRAQAERIITAQKN